MIGKKEKEEERFVETLVRSGGGGTTFIHTDRETGVQYLLITRGNDCGVTVLVDENGKPLLNEEYRKNK